MNLPKIDLSSLPDLTDMVGMFGSKATQWGCGCSDDSLIVLMVFVYDFVYIYGGH